MKKLFKYLVRMEVFIEAESVEEANHIFGSVNLGELANEERADALVGYEFHSVQTIEEQSQNGTFEPIDRVLRGGDIK